MIRKQPRGNDEVYYCSDDEVERNKSPCGQKMIRLLQEEICKYILRILGQFACREPRDDQESGVAEVVDDECTYKFDKRVSALQDDTDLKEEMEV